MALADRLIQQSLDKATKVRAGTALQDALEKVKRARKVNEYAFDIAIGELWILAGDVFKERNSLRIKLAQADKRIKELEEALKHYQRLAE